jgi:CubicO group peptidase (beta-lactamase class C family)
VIAVRGGEIVLRKGYGSANLELAVPMRPEHVFRIGSITKQFTAVAILQLVEAGKLRLDDDVVAHVPELQTGGKTVTARAPADPHVRPPELHRSAGMAGRRRARTCRSRRS